MSESKKFQEFLDNGQYSKTGVEKYEWIFGETFLSCGGRAIVPNILKHAKLGPNPKALDLGSGLGGHSFLIAENFDAEVLGLDLSVNMMELANTYLKSRPYLEGKVTFRIEDYTKSSFPENSFDLVYSRESFVHIAGKLSLFTNIYKWLKLGGYFLFTDYVRGEDEGKYSEEFKEYLKNRKYHMITASEYNSVLLASGFQKIEVKNWTQDAKNHLQTEVNKLRDSKDLFLKRFSEEDYDHLESGWSLKIRRVDSGFLGYVFGVARKLPE